MLAFFPPIRHDFYRYFPKSSEFRFWRKILTGQTGSFHRLNRWHGHGFKSQCFASIRKIFIPCNIKEFAFSAIYAIAVVVFHFLLIFQLQNSRLLLHVIYINLIFPGMKFYTENRRTFLYLKKRKFLVPKKGRSFQRPPAGK